MHPCLYTKNIMWFSLLKHSIMWRFSFVFRYPLRVSNLLKVVRKASSGDPVQNSIFRHHFWESWKYWQIRCLFQDFSKQQKHPSYNNIICLHPPPRPSWKNDLQLRKSFKPCGGILHSVFLDSVLDKIKPIWKLHTVILRLQWRWI